MVGLGTRLLTCAPQRYEITRVCECARVFSSVFCGVRVYVCACVCVCVCVCVFIKHSLVVSPLVKPMGAFGIASGESK